jgi:hypothetical protein
MKKLSITAIIQKIQQGEHFHAVAEDYSFTIKIDAYVPYICTAIHDGHQFRKALWAKCLHTEYERWFEEDPETFTLIESHPITIKGNDSRFEYDLNRTPEKAIYEDAWGKQLWKTPLSDSEKILSLSKHTNFYKVIHALVAKTEEKHGFATVFDMHSYNWKRWNREVPTFNIGTANVNMKRFGTVVEAWRTALESIVLPNKIKNTAKINDVFQGNGYLLKFVAENFENTLVLATELKKVYCDELTAIMYPEVVDAIARALENKIPENIKLVLRS